MSSQSFECQVEWVRLECHQICKTLAGEMVEKFYAGENWGVLLLWQIEEEMENH